MPSTDASLFYDAPVSRTGKPNIPPIIVSCAFCERTIGDSTAFVAGSRNFHTITFSEVVSVTTGDGKLETAKTGDWDEFCNYMTLYCEKCGTTLGRRYYAVMNHLMHLQGKFTLDVPKLSFYQLGAKTPSLPVAETAEIMGLIQPKPDELGEKLAQVMMLCMWLREEQESMIRALRKLGRHTGADLSEELPVEEGVEESAQVQPEWKSKYEELEQRMAMLEQLKDSLKATPLGRQENTSSPRPSGSRRQSERLEEDSDDEPVRKRHKGRLSSASMRNEHQTTASPQPREHAFSSLRQGSTTKETETQKEANAQTSPRPNKAPLKVIVDNTLLSRSPLQTKPQPDQDIESIRKQNKSRAEDPSVEIVTIRDSQETELSTTQESTTGKHTRNSIGGTGETDKSKAKKPQEKRRTSGRATRQLK